MVEVVVADAANKGAEVGQAGESAADAHRPCTPGTDVAMGRKAPRISSGASGLGSQVSSWLWPPLVKTTRTDFALPKPRNGRVVAPAFAVADPARGPRPARCRPAQPFAAGQDAPPVSSPRSAKTETARRPLGDGSHLRIAARGRAR